MASNINPSLTPVNNLANFRFWCQKVLPLVYDDSLSYYEVLGKMVVQLNDVIDNVNADTENVLTLKDAFLALQTYVNNFFDDIDQLASYAERAEAAQTAANTSAVNAATSASNASASSLAAMDARDTAVAARQAAQASANTASTAATNANTKANEAAQSAITAQTAQASASQSATLAATDRSAAQTAASTATTKASEASTSATNAETSANNAAQSKEDAEEAANNIQENLDNIQKNTQDISDLKESVKPILQLSPMPTFPEDFLQDLNTTIHGRTFIRSKNKVIVKYSSNNDTARYYTIIRNGGIDYNTSLPNLRNGINESTLIPRPQTSTGLLLKVKVHNNDNIARAFPGLYLIYRSAYSHTNLTYTLYANSTESVDAEINLGFDLTFIGEAWCVCAFLSNSHTEIEVEYLFYNTEPTTKIINQLIAPTQYDYIAKEDKQVNDLIIINHTLYRVIAPVESGGNYTVDSNIQLTSIGSLLTTLLNT